MLDQRFEAATLHQLRERVLAVAKAAGLQGSRAIDVMLVVHELAANAVRHGPGWGRARIANTATALYCEITDTGPARADGEAEPWPYRPGHGLWLVRQAADQVRVVTGPAGSAVTAVFGLPGGPDIPDAG